MKRFLCKILICLIIPLIAVVGVYIWVDPFRVVRPFDIAYFLSEDIGKTSREYFSYELYNHQRKYRNYNSFIFGSSRTQAFNSYQWKTKLPNAENAFFFTGWTENIRGIYQKICYLDAIDADLDNCLIVLDVGVKGSFNDSDGKVPLSRHYYKLDGGSAINYHVEYFSAFMSPSTIVEKTNHKFRNNDKYGITQVDTITNDPRSSNNSLIPPSYPTELIVCSPPPALEDVLHSTLTDALRGELKVIREIFYHRNSHYKIVITPNFYKQKINPSDLSELQGIFGKENVYDFSGISDFNDPHLYSDVNHFWPYVGWQIVEKIYNDTIQK